MIKEFLQLYENMPLFIRIYYLFLISVIIAIILSWINEKRGNIGRYSYRSLGLICFFVEMIECAFLELNKVAITELYYRVGEVSIFLLMFCSIYFFVMFFLSDKEY